MCLCDLAGSVTAFHAPKSGTGQHCAATFAQSSTTPTRITSAFSGGGSGGSGKPPVHSQSNGTATTTHHKSRANSKADPESDSESDTESALVFINRGPQDSRMILVDPFYGRAQWIVDGDFEISSSTKPIQGPPMDTISDDGYVVRDFSTCYGVCADRRAEMPFLYVTDYDGEFIHVFNRKDGTFVNTICEEDDTDNNNNNNNNNDNNNDDEGRSSSDDSIHHPGLRNGKGVESNAGPRRSRRPGRLSAPHSVVMNAAMNLFASCRPPLGTEGPGWIVELDTCGSVVQTFGHRVLRDPQQLCLLEPGGGVSPNGNANNDNDDDASSLLLVSDCLQNAVLAFSTTNGDLQPQACIFDDLYWPTGIAVDECGCVAVADNPWAACAEDLPPRRVQIFSGDDGALVGSIPFDSHPELGDCYFLYDLVYTAGSLFVCAGLGDGISSHTWRVR